MSSVYHAFSSHLTLRCVYYASSAHIPIQKVAYMYIYTLFWGMQRLLVSMVCQQTKKLFGKSVFTNFTPNDTSSLATSYLSCSSS